jgi:hypothetical protein
MGLKAEALVNSMFRGRIPGTGSSGPRFSAKYADMRSHTRRGQRAQTQAKLHDFGSS